MDEITKEQVFRKAVDILEYDYDCRYYPDYSGRFMYGKRVPALVIEDASPIVLGLGIVKACIDLGLSIDDAEEFIPVRSDNMGRGTIYY